MPKFYVHCIHDDIRIVHVIKVEADTQEEAARRVAVDGYVGFHIDWRYGKGKCVDFGTLGVEASGVFDLEFFPAEAGRIIDEYES
jgi:hypothetical protein